MVYLAVVSETVLGERLWIGAICQTSKDIKLREGGSPELGTDTSSVATMPSRTAIPPELEPIPV